MHELYTDALYIHLIDLHNQFQKDLINIFKFNFL